jgi:hypothetical protein
MVIARSTLTALVLATAIAKAQLLPTGTELQVNTFTTSFQTRPVVAVDPGGEFVVSWTSFGSSGSDSDGLSIQGQRYSADGVSVGGEFQVNAYTTRDQHLPAVAADPSGRFVVTWRSLGSYGPDVIDDSVQAQYFDVNGLPAGGQFQANTYTTGHQRRSAVAFDGLGNLVVAWASNGSSGSDASSESVQAQRYDVNGDPLGSEFQVNTYTTGNQRLPDVARGPAGDFVVVWQSSGSSGSDSSNDSIQAQRFDADGIPLGAELQVNSFTTDAQRSPAVAMDAQGNFVVVWGSLGSTGPDTSYSSVQARLYDFSGTPLGPEFQVNSFTTGYQRYPAVATDAAGNFVVVWQSGGSLGSDSSGYSIQARHFAADGSALGTELQVNTFTTGAQEFVAVAANGQQRFVAVWQSLGSSGTDLDASSIQAQRLDAAFFGDGFEIGDSRRWSETVP